MSKIITPTFETQRLILRELTLSDKESYQKNFNNYEVIKNLSAAVPWPYPENGAEFFIQNIVKPNQGITRWDWAITLKTHPSEVIGSIGLFHPGAPENRGFWLAQKYWGQGLMTEAVTPVTEFAFNILNLNELVFANAVGNTKSRRVKEKTGATFSESRPLKFVNPDFTHSEYWKLSKEDWLKSR